MKRFLAILGVLVFGAGMFFAGFFVRNYTDPDLASLKFILDKYKKYYLEEEEDYLEIMVEGLLDQYSDYYTKEEYEIIKKSAQGVRAGVGLTVADHGGDAYVYSVKGNSPAEIAGVERGGIIVGIKKATEEQFQSVDYKSFSSTISAIADGEKFNIKVVYGDEEREFELAKREYTETYVFYTDSTGSYRFTDGGGKDVKLVHGENQLGVAIPSDTAYLKYVSFNGTTNDLYGSKKQVKTVMDKFKETGKSKIIIDLRGNGGGFMDIMCDLTAHFVGADANSKPLVSYALYKDGKKDEFNSASVKYNDYGFESIIILANDGTASASEAFIGACLDYDSRNVVKVVLSKNARGEYRSYGKGIMQTTFENVGVGDAIKLTTAKIYWPKSNVSIHGVGITKGLSGFEGKILEAPFEENVDCELLYALSL
ncbi:MAG: hypothetical protein IKA61_05115 [Clostridia bacterium]|nr:hypothetical protein [Clostridia bacterium]